MHEYRGIDTDLELVYIYIRAGMSTRFFVKEQ